MAKRRQKSPASEALVRASDQLRQHHDLAQAGAVQYVRTAVDTMLASRTIGERERLTADRWYRDYALAVHGAADPSQGGNGDSPGGWMDAQVAAVCAYNAARSAIGVTGDTLMRVFVGSGVSLRAASRSGSARDWLSGRLAVTLERLGEHYAMMDRSRR